jgi:DNA-damage-inducible protein J
MDKKSATINARIAPVLKSRAEYVLAQVGIEPAEAIRAFYAQIVLRHGIPFELAIPNKATKKAIKDIHEGKTKKVKSIHALLHDLE